MLPNRTELHTQLRADWAGHGRGFNDLKAIECRHLIATMAGKSACVIDFDKGFEIERAVHAMAAAHDKRGWRRPNI
nr:hypothetical protein [Marinicella sp. W31]MDC2880266.1 hypothetical protein [Marinicella sp. W31]